MPIKTAINGFGRIGRAAYKIAHNNDQIDIVAVNDLTNPRVLAHLLKYDTAYGVYDKEIYLEEDGKKVTLEEAAGDKDFFTKSGKENYLVVGGRKTKILSEKDPSILPWKELQINVVLECTGRFTKDDTAKAHLEAGAEKVIVSAPTKGGDTKTFLKGVNDEKISAEKIISNASCTTNCVAPVISVINSNFGILKAGMTTIHAVTSTQNVVDGPPQPNKPDLRRARAACYNMIPTTTGAAIATTEVIPDLENIFDGIAVRVPVITGSLSDITALIKKKTTVEEINNAFIKAEKKPIYKNVLKATYEPIVSSDIIKSKFSAIVDLSMTKVIDGDLVKILAWYDNEWGYSHRLIDMAIVMSKTYDNTKISTLA